MIPINSTNINCFHVKYIHGMRSSSRIVSPLFIITYPYKLKNIDSDFENYYIINKPIEFKNSLGEVIHMDRYSIHSKQTISMTIGDRIQFTDFTKYSSIVLNSTYLFHYNFMSVASFNEKQDEFYQHVLKSSTNLDYGRRINSMPHKYHKYLKDYETYKKWN